MEHTNQPTTQATTPTTPEQHVLLINGKPATATERARILNAKPQPARPVVGNLNVTRGFSLLR